MFSEQLKSVVSNSEGDLLFYTDGLDVFDRNFELMPNGANIGESESIYTFSSMPVVSVPFPDEANKYYIFTLSNGFFFYFNGRYVPGILHYSILDMELNDGKGDIVSGQKKIFIRESLSGRLVAAKGECGHLWVIVREMDTNRFLAYKITSEGIQDPVISTVGSVLNIPASLPNPESQEDGSMFFSPGYDRLALLDNRGLTVEVFDFDRSTGRFSNAIALPVAQKTKWVNYGSFSPDNSQLYLVEVHTGNNDFHVADYYQFDLTSRDMNQIQQSKVLIASSELGGYKTQMQLGPDSMLYITEAESIATINSPNLQGVAATYQDTVYTIRNADNEVDKAIFSLMNPTVIPDPPSIVPSLILPHDTQICEAQVITLDIARQADRIRWQDGSSNPAYTIERPGSYWVDVFRGNCTFTDTIHVQASLFPKIDLLGPDTLICKETSLELEIDDFAGTVVWQNGSTSQKFLVTEAGTYFAEAIDSTGCVARDSMVVTTETCIATQVIIPNAFTPNNDGDNDYFNIVVDGRINKYNIIDFRIYNRWGQLIYNNGDPELGWDGQFNGRPAPSDVYIYRIQVKLAAENEIKSWYGDVTLIR